ncbi:MAG: hypothetical protein OXE96_09295 [Gemmatimonadetes bacterium]|nr:hypothetical protein [Gemmatimonadota bacterium]
MLALLPACDPAEDPPAQSASSGPPAAPVDAELVDMAAFSESFEVVRSLTLAESDQAMTVRPLVTNDGRGQLLVSEPMEGQVNVYGFDGELRAVLGRRGEGPGEFAFPLIAHPTSDGGVVVGDVELSRLTFFPPAGEGDPEVVATPVEAIQGAQDLGDGRYLLAGTISGEDQPRFFHIWDRAANRLERSFLPMGVPEESRAYASSFQGASATLEHDTIWAVWALSDTLYKFDTQGELLGRLPLPLVRPMGELPRAGGVVSDPADRQSMFDRMTEVFGVYILRGGDLVVQSLQTRDFDAVWDLLIIDRLGRLVWSAPNMPRLFALEDDLFYFDDPASVLPNRWLVARLKSRE